MTYTSAKKIDLFDVVSKKYLAKGGKGTISIKLPAGEAALIVFLPAGTRLTYIGSKVKAGETVITYK